MAGGLGRIVAGRLWIEHELGQRNEHHVASDGKFTDVVLANGNENGGAAPCWTLDADLACDTGSLVLHVMSDVAGMNAASSSSTLERLLCGPGTAPGC